MKNTDIDREKSSPARSSDLSEEEPSLGSNDNFRDQTRWAANASLANSWEVDLEAEHDGREPDEADLEISDVEAHL